MCFLIYNDNATTSCRLCYVECISMILYMYWFKFSVSIYVTNFLFNLCTFFSLLFTVVREIFVSKTFRALNFRVKIFSYRRPLTWMMHTLYTAMKNFVHLIFILNRAYEKILTTKISQTTVVDIQR